ncbi:MAG: hypothetical protein R3E68_23290 [Burkholderiaceae bacterium]
MKLGLGLYLIPLGMIANPPLLALADHPALALLAMAKVGIALAMLSYALIAMRRIPARIGLMAAGLLVLLLPFAPIE